MSRICIVQLSSIAPFSETNSPRRVNAFGQDDRCISVARINYRCLNDVHSELFLLADRNAIGSLLFPKPFVDVEFFLIQMDSLSDKERALDDSGGGGGRLERCLHGGVKRFECVRVDP